MSAPVLDTGIRSGQESLANAAHREMLRAFVVWAEIGLDSGWMGVLCGLDMRRWVEQSEAVGLSAVQSGITHHY